jgi:anti-anti-sigma factor
LSANRFEPAPPESGPPRRRFRSLKVTGRSRPGIYAREAIAPICQIDLATTDKAATLTVAGQMDISCGDRFIACLREARDSAPSRLLIDLRGVTFIDSTGLALLLKADGLARQHQFELQVVRSGAKIVQAVLEATGVEKFLPFVDELPVPPS